jgi:hypothetical protein
MAVTRESVIYAFRLILGREIETEADIEAHMQLENEQVLVEALLKSIEFSANNRFSDILEISNKKNTYGQQKDDDSFFKKTINFLLDMADTLKQINVRKILDMPAPKRVNTRFKKKFLARKAGGYTNHASLNVLLFGNCQVNALARLLQSMTGGIIAYPFLMNAAVRRRLHNGGLDKLIAESDLILAHSDNEFISIIESRVEGASAKIRKIPRINFAAFHPDAEYIYDKSEKHVTGPLGDYHSSIVFYAWSKGLNLQETAALFNEKVFKQLGFFDYWAISKNSLLKEGADTNLDLNTLIERWTQKGEWMYSMNHPKLFVLADLARAILMREGVPTLLGAEQFIDDELANGPVWPLYPELARKLSLKGHYQFKLSRGVCTAGQPILMLGLDDFIQKSFEVYENYSKDELICKRLSSPRYLALDDFLASTAYLQKPAVPVSIGSVPAGQKSQSQNPYKGLPDFHFWRRAVEQTPFDKVDPIVKPKLVLTMDHKIATAGSCFAQHISRTLHKNGFNYYVSETAPENITNAEERNFGVFSARYGNIYTARQLIQLYDRAYGEFNPAENYWVRHDGKFVDPFRPQIEPDGFNSIGDLDAARKEHFASVRQLFETLDVFIFTLGLTESWRNKNDGAVYPLAPGVVAGVLDEDIHEFVNFSVADVVEDMNLFIQRLSRVNPNAKMLITVSPVPLIATYEDRHVLVSTTYSKSVLRAAADEIVQRNLHCEYFPSYEIITGLHTKGCYFENDLRSVKAEGVEQVMGLFLSHYAASPNTNINESLAFAAELEQESSAISNVICDEEAIDQHI